MAKDSKNFDPPAGLSGKSCALWASVVPSRGKSPGRLAILEEGLRALDRAMQAAGEIEKTGLTTTTKKSGAVHIHPLLRVERENRQVFLATMDKLHLTWDANLDGCHG